MYTKTIDGIYSKSNWKTAPKRSFLKKIDWRTTKIIALSVLFTAAIVGQIMGYAINWGN